MARRANLLELIPSSWKSLVDSTIDTAEALDDSETIIDCSADPTGSIAVGDLIRIEDEFMGRVTAISAAPANITVAARGYSGPVVTHATAKDIFKVQKRQCVLYLPGQDDPQSGTIRDRSGYNNHGTITGATWARQANGVWAQSFDGVDDHVNCGNNTSLQISNNFTISAWMKIRRTANYEYIVAKGQAWTAGWWIQKNVLTTNIIFSYMGAGGGRTSSNLSFTLNSFGLITYTFSNGTVIGYLNGSQVTSDTFVDATVVGFATNNLILGSAPDLISFYADCVIAEMDLYNKVLTASEVNNLYRNHRHLLGV